MISLGLDPSLRAYGWCVHNSEENGKNRRVDSGSHSTTSDMVPVVRFMQFREMVGDLIQKYHPQVVGIESPAYDGPFQVIHHGLLLFSLESIFKHRKDVTFFDPSTLKSLVRGNSSKKGQINKIDVQRFVSLDMMDPKLLPNDEADAYALGYFAARLFGVLDGSVPPGSLSESEKRVFIEKTRKIKTLKGSVVKPNAQIYRENSRIFRFSKLGSNEIQLPKKSSINLTIA